MKTTEIQGVATSSLSTLTEEQLWTLLEAVRVSPASKPGDKVQRTRNYIAVRNALQALSPMKDPRSSASLAARLGAMFSGMEPTPELDGGPA